MPASDNTSDVLQEGYVRIWLNAGEFRYRKGSPMIRMISIMRNQAIDMMHHNDRRPPSVDLDDVAPVLAAEGDGALEHAEHRQRRVRLQQCLAY